MSKHAMGPMGGGGQPSDTSHRETDYCKTCGGRIYKVNDGSPDKYAWQHDIEQGAGVPHQAFPGGAAAGEDPEAIAMQSMLVEAAKAKKPVSQMTDAEYAVHRDNVARDKEAGERWNRQNPPRIKHVVDHWHQATEDERATGMSWYEDRA